MQQPDYRDILGGGLLLLLGLFMIWYAASSLSLGTIRRMGPGMFPMGVGGLLAMFGLLIAVPALFRRGELPAVEWRTAAAVLAGIAAFAIAIRTVGLAPAIIAQLVVTAGAEREFRPLALLVMALTFPLAAYLIFGVGLGLPVPMLRWPA